MAFAWRQGFPSFVHACMHKSVLKKTLSRIIEWDITKAESNYRKHGIRFEEAALVFDDPLPLHCKTDSKTMNTPGKR